MIQSGSLVAVSWKVWVVGGVTFALSVALSAYLLFTLDKPTPPPLDSDRTTTKEE